MDVIDGEWIAKRMTGWRGEKAALARFMGVEPDVVAKILSGKRRVQPEEMPQVVAFFDDQKPAVGIQHGETAPDGTELIPVYDVEASAGHGAVVDGEEHVSSLAFPFDYLRRLTRANPRDLRIITVKGDSMLPTLSDDDVVMLDVSKQDLSYDGLFVVRDNGEGLLVKRIGRASRSGFISLISDNRDVYPTVERSVEDIQVIGKVLWQGRKV